MKSQSVELTSTGIRRMLKKYTPERAIAEYIWNGFDAKSKVITLEFEFESQELDTMKSLTISDTGNGICYDDLQYKFRPILESQKRHATDEGDFVRGKNGYGRLTFFRFANYATWDTTYEKENKRYNYKITIDGSNLAKYTPTDKIEVTNNVGTRVKFVNLSEEISNAFIEHKLKPFLRAEFAWFLELNSEFKILINGEELICTSIIEDNISMQIDACGKTFNCKYLLWNVKPNDEFSRFYFLNSSLDVKGTKTTLLNKKGDNFWHSIVIIDDFFDQEMLECKADKTISPGLFEDKNARKTYKSLIENLNEFLKRKRRPFLKEQANVLINSYHRDKVFPYFGNSEWEEKRKEELEELVKNLYEVEPRVFLKLNTEQKSIFLQLLNLIIDSGERESLFKIIGEVVDLDSNDRKEFAKLLDTTRLKYVISTIKLIKDRILVLEDLKQLVFNHELKAGEVKHLQKFIEKHYWIFGEEYRFICAEEVKFEEALRKYLYVLRGVDEKTIIEHPDKYKEMDLFLSGTEYRNGGPHNLVVEIKNPTTIKVLTNKEYGQIESYIDVIMNSDCFNDNREQWAFYLIGQDYNDIIERKIINKDTGLTMNAPNCKLYVKKWSQIVNDVELRLQYLLEKLNIERTKLSKANVLDEVMDEVTNNSAIMKTNI
ncbi:MAG: ATP-binding protein [Prevotellaceae bacterium]|nr:ATP-binding protein [Prevotellaceae bacterium]